METHKKEPFDLAQDSFLLTSWWLTGKKKGAINCAKNMKLKSKRDKNYEHHRKHNQKYFTVSMWSNCCKTLKWFQY